MEANRKKGRGVGSGKKSCRGDQAIGLIERARAFALVRHAGQMYFALVRHAGQMYGDAPYALHLYQVALLAERANLVDYQVAAAWLHDVVEDGHATLEEINELFGVQVCGLVAMVTDDQTQPRRVRVPMMIQRLQHDDQAIDLKLCDRLANVLEAKARRPDLMKMYQKEWAEFQTLRQYGGSGVLWLKLTEAMEE